MKDKKGRVLLVILLIVLLSVFAFLIYTLYQYIPGEPQEMNAVLETPKLETRNLSYTVKQFYPNMKFNHNSISYTIDSQCSQGQSQMMLLAFSELASKVGEINFVSLASPGNTPDIEVSCSGDAKPFTEKDFFIAGEGGAKEIIKTERYNVITQGIVLLYDTEQTAVQCDWPNLEMHELLHVFGFEHSQDKNSLMYPYLESCDQKLDDSIVQDLKELYSRENLPDLYFGDVQAVKKGRYLDFNVTVKNSGDVYARGVSLTVLDSGEELENFFLDDIPFGGGVNFQVSNLRLRSRSSSDIEIVLDNYNSIKEIDKANNIAKLEFR